MKRPISFLFVVISLLAAPWATTMVGADEPSPRLPLPSNSQAKPRGTE